MSDLPPAYLFLDPGDSKYGGVTGWAYFDANGDIHSMGQFHSSVSTGELQTLILPTLTLVVYEGYINAGYKTSTHAWSKNETSQLIGKIKTLCELVNVKWAEVRNTEMSVGYAWMGMEQPKNHAISHQWDAVAHGVCWLQKNGINEAGKFLKGKT